MSGTLRMMEGDDHKVQVPVHLETMLAAMTELENVLGVEGKPVVAGVREHVIQAMAARDRGDRAATMESIGLAMRSLAGLGDILGPQEAPLIEMLAQRFQSSMLGGDLAAAKADMDVMFERSGATYRGKKD